MTEECEVCEGEGTYPVMDKYGKHRFSISCPECFGSGTCEPDEDEEQFEYPPSTAAGVHSIEDLRALNAQSKGEG